MYFEGSNRRYFFDSAAADGSEGVRVDNMNPPGELSSPKGRMSEGRRPDIQSFVDVWQMESYSLEPSIPFCFWDALYLASVGVGVFLVLNCQELGQIDQEPVAFQLDKLDCRFGLNCASVSSTSLCGSSSWSTVYSDTCPA